MDQKNSRKASGQGKPGPASEPSPAPAVAPSHDQLSADAPAADAAVTDLSFEQAMAQLEQVVGALEAGQLPLAQALSAYQRGAALMRHAQSILTHVQSEIDVIEAGQAKAMDRSTLIAQIKE